MSDTKQILQHLKSNAKSKKKENKKLINKLKSKNPREVDDIIHEEHDIVFEKIDCLDCANCCKTTGPLFTDKDINRIAAHLKLKSIDFIDQYLHVDEDDDHVLQQVPCSFLEEDNYCSIYDVRPKACREYPHTDRKKQAQLFHLTLRNTEICPAVYQLFEKIKETIR